MRTIFVFLLFCCLTILTSLTNVTAPAAKWIKKDSKGFSLYYTKADASILKRTMTQLKTGMTDAAQFFQKKSFPVKFQVYLFPNRGELDQQWSKDWKIENFKSECWMVASGVAKRLDILSPLSWKKQACDHNADDQNEIQKIITHELVHVFHAQHNPNPTFDGMDDLSWFVEGLAAYASGQLTKERIKKVTEQFKLEKVPLTLARLWTGADKYARAGSFVQFLDEEYGRKKIIELLSFTTNDSILKSLGTDDASLISKWKTKLMEN